MFKKNDVVMLTLSGTPALVVAVRHIATGQTDVRICTAQHDGHYWVSANALKPMMLVEGPKPSFNEGDVVWTTAQHCELSREDRIDTSKPAIVGGGSRRGNPGIYAQMQRLGSEDTRMCICYVPVESLTLARVEPRETT